MVEITWLGQAGLLFEIEGKRIVVDPYLSNSVENINPNNYRRQKIDSRFLEIKPDVIILTHNHLDHTDPDTLKFYLKNEESILVLASGNAWNEVRAFGGNHNYVMFNRHTVWSYDGIKFSAVYAEHSDMSAIGVIIGFEGKKYYITGDTLYNTKIFEDLPDDIYCVFLPINGVGNNMNMVDAETFCEKIGSKAVPMHCGLFDDINMNVWQYRNKIVPEIYKKILL